MNNYLLNSNGFEKAKAGGQNFLKHLQKRLIEILKPFCIIPRVMLFVAPDGKYFQIGIISGAMKHNYSLSVTLSLQNNETNRNTAV